MQNIAQDTILNLDIPLSTLAEQENILSHINKETVQIDALIARIEEGVKKLQEYSTALISAAVTGKIDVRNVTSKEEEKV